VLAPRGGRKLLVTLSGAALLGSVILVLGAAPLDPLIVAQGAAPLDPVKSDGRGVSGSNGRRRRCLRRLGLLGGRHGSRRRIPRRARPS